MGWIPETTVLTEMGNSGCWRGDFLDPDATIGTKITTVDFRFGEYFGIFWVLSPKSRQKINPTFSPISRFSLGFYYLPTFGFYKSNSFRLLQIQPHVPYKRNQSTNNNKKLRQSRAFLFCCSYVKRDRTPQPNPAVR